jgi:glyoxylase-like metal-dependent hydrolase (beta-lactamase superfamily II)
MAQQARKLTGRWPTHVVLTHFHGDHVNGMEGYGGEERPDILATERTRDLISEADAGRGVAADSLRASMLADVVIINPSAAARIDLGNRTVHLVPREGHTPSDVTVEIAEPSIVWCGDLVWNRMFPNYRDAIPSQLSRDVRSLAREHATVYVPGHGPVADGIDLDRYIALIDDVEAAARLAHERGMPATEAAESYSIPESLGEWVMFSPRYYEVALSAWEKELDRM